MQRRLLWGGVVALHGRANGVGVSLLREVGVVGRGGGRVASQPRARAFSGTPPRAVFVSMGGGRGAEAPRTPDRVMMKEQSVQCVIGCNPDERVRTQELLLSVAVWVDLRDSLSKHVKDCDQLDVQKTRMDAPDWERHAAAELAGTHNYSTLAKIARKTAEEGKYFTIEALAEAIARDVVLACNVPRVTVLIDKPEALRKKGARAAAVEITRDREDFFFKGQKPMKYMPLPDTSAHAPQQQSPSHSPGSAPFAAAAAAQLAAELSASCEPFQKFGHVAYIALGSNVGERAKNIQQALRLLCEDSASSSVQLMSTSFLYESPASYVTDQPNFVNAVCKVSTALEPLQLLAKLKQVEQSVGRQERYRWGPREVDLDIIFYDKLVYEAPDRSLIIPHARAHERDFVLGPLCDISPEYVHPGLKASCAALLRHLLTHIDTPRCALERVLPLPLPSTSGLGGGVKEGRGGKGRKGGGGSALMGGTGGIGRGSESGEGGEEGEDAVMLVSGPRSRAVVMGKLL